MLWIDIIKIVLPGIIMGVLLGKLLVKKTYYPDLLNPKNWISETKRASRKKLIRIAVISISLGVSSYFSVVLIENIAIGLFGPDPFLSEDNVFVEISEFFYPIFIISISVIPIIEEWLFRGIILNEIRKKYNSKVLALLLSSLIFASFHLFNPGTYLLALIPYTVGGVFMGLSYLLGGLSSATFCHIIYNLTPFLIGILS